jgi:hypothetical protein
MAAMNFFQQMVSGEIAHKNHLQKELERQQREQDREYEIEKRNRERQAYERAQSLVPMEEERYRREHEQKMRSMDRAEAEQRMSDFVQPFRPSRGYNEQNERVLDTSVPVSPAVYAAAMGMGAGLSPAMIEDSLEHPVKPFNHASIEGYRTDQDIEQERKLAHYKEQQAELLLKQRAIEAERTKRQLLVEAARNARSNSGPSRQTTNLKKNPITTVKIKRFTELEKAWQNQMIQDFMEKFERQPTPEEYQILVKKAREMAAIGSGIGPFAENLELASEEDFITLYSESDSDNEYVKPFPDAPTWLLPGWLQNLYKPSAGPASGSLYQKLRQMEEKAGQQLSTQALQEKEELIKKIMKPSEKKEQQNLTMASQVGFSPRYVSSTQTLQEKEELIKKIIQDIFRGKQ